MKSRSLCTMSNCRNSVLFVWAISLVLACPVVFSMEEESVAYSNSECTERVIAYYCKPVDSDTALFMAYRLLILFCIPGLLMIAFYTVVIRELWKSTKNICVLTNSSSNAETLIKSDSCHVSPSVERNHELSEEGGAFCNQRSCSERHLGSRMNSNQFSSQSIYSISSSTQGGSDYKSLQVAPSRKSRLSRCLEVPQSKVHFRLPSPIRKNRREKGDDVKRARKQVIKMLIVVVLLFVICWGPTIFTEMMISLGKQIFTKEFYVFISVSSLLPFVHCCINPIIYCCMSKNFRKSMAKVLCKPCNNCKRFFRSRSAREQCQGGMPSSAASGVSLSYSPDLTTAQTDLEAVSKI